MNEICVDNRFEIIEKAKKHLLEATNIETAEDEMKVLNSFLFRCWQMGWLKQYDDTIEAEPVRHGEWIHTDMAASWKPSCKDECGECHYHDKDHRDLSDFKFCPMCGSKMDGREEK